MAGTMIGFVLVAAITIDGTVGYVLPDNIVNEAANENYDNYDYPDKYPIVVSKRAALLLDRLMVALQKAVEDQDGGVGIAPDRTVRASDPSRKPPSRTPPRTDKSSIDRRYPKKIYWQCYFNAVTCFK